MTCLRLGLAGLLVLASCGSSPPPQLSVRDAWARETVPGQTSAAVYLTIANVGGRDRLIETHTRAAGSATLHSSSSADGIARMRPIHGGLEIPADGRVALKPGGDHVMLTDLGLVLRAGSAIELRLAFERSGGRTVRVRIVDAAAESGHEGH